MTFSERLDLLKKASRKIKQEATGPPEVFARDLGIPRTNLYRIKLDLEERGAAIKYDRQRQTYYFEQGSEPGW